MWTKFFIFLLFINQAFGTNYIYNTPDSLSEEKFHSEFKFIRSISNNSKRDKALLDFINKKLKNDELFTNFSYKIFNKDNLTSFWVEECGKYVDNLLKTGGLALAQQFVYNLYEEQIEFSEIERLIIQKIQQEPNDINYVELLISTYIFNGFYDKSWSQRRALDRRLKSEQGQRASEFALYMVQSQQWILASQIFDYLEKAYPVSNQKLRWQQMSIAAREQMILGKERPELVEVRKLILSYQTLRSERGDNAVQLSSYWQEAKLYAFQLQLLDSAILVLEKGIFLSDMDLSLQAQMKLELGDFLTFKGKKYDALIQYAQVEKQVKDSPLSYEAKLKTAKLYFYTGDFELSKELVDILKQSTQREIANDALELSLLIEDNYGIDSLEIGLQAYANIRFLFDQLKWNEGDILLAQLMEKNKQESLIDDLLFLKATRARQKGDNDIAKELYWSIFKKYPDDIYGDDSLYFYLTLSDSSNSEPFILFIDKYPSSLFLSDVRNLLNYTKK